MTVSMETSLTPSDWMEHSLLVNLNVLGWLGGQKVGGVHQSSASRFLQFWLVVLGPQALTRVINVFHGIIRI